MYYLELYYKTNSGKKGMVEFEMEEYNDEETEICEMINKALEIKDKYDIKEITHFDIIEGDEENDEDNDDDEDENEERAVNDSYNYDYCDGECMDCNNYNCVLCENEKRITLL